MNLAIYLTGALVLIAGLVGGAHLVGVPTQWLVILATIAIGLSIMGGVATIRGTAE